MRRLTKVRPIALHHPLNTYSGIIRRTSLLAIASGILICMASQANAVTMPTQGQNNAPFTTQRLSCFDPGNNSSGTGQADDSTGRNTVYGSCPNTSIRPQGIPHRTTEAISLISEWNPALYAHLVDKDGHWWSSPYSRGTPGNYALVSAFVGDDQPCNDASRPGCRRINGAHPQVSTTRQPATFEERACLNRIKMMQASAQTIMNAALYPMNYEEVKHIAWEEGLSSPAARMSPQAHCQTFTKVPDPEAEYDWGSYVASAYDKTLVDPSTQMSAKLAPLHEPKRNTLLSYFVGNAQAALTAGKTDEPMFPANLEGGSYQGRSQQIKQVSNINVPLMGSNGNGGKEALFDVTHPFSPRWDFRDNERDWGSPKGALYSKNEKDNVVCADLAKPGNNRTKVDILSFRRNAFVPEMNKRIELNQQCYRNTGPYSNPCCLRTGGLFPKCIPQPCWKCFGLFGKTETPPCSTSWSQESDRTILTIYRPTKGFRKLPCGESAPSLCEKLRAPYRMANMVKIRRSQCGSPKSELDVNPDGSCASPGEGMHFTSYFGNHMPYPIQHDTGAPIRDIFGPANQQHPLDYAGQYASIVGVGRPRISGGGNLASIWKQPDHASDIANSLTPISTAHAAAGGGGAPSNSTHDERCKYGGWGAEDKCMGMEFATPGAPASNGRSADPTTAWSEYLNYVATGIRKYNMNCVMQQHKAFAPLDAVSKALARCGAATFQRQVCTRRNQDGSSTACTGDAQPGDYWENRPMTWPLAYRGQTCSANQLKEDMKLPLNQRICFPYFGAREEPNISRGLDNAKPGCIIIMPTGGVGDARGDGGANSSESDSKKPLMPTVSCIISAQNNASNSNCASKGNCHLIVSTADDGQYPDVCGNTAYSGEPMNRTIYKPGMLPESIGNELMDIQRQNKVTNPTKYCENPQFGYCELEGWNDVMVYCPNDDVRGAE